MKYNLAMLITTVLIVWALADLTSFLIACAIFEVATYRPYKQYKPGRWQKNTQF